MSFWKYTILVICLLVLASIFKEPDLEPLNFIEIRASELTEKERVEVCHSLLGNVKEQFSYKLEKDEVWSTYNNKPEKYCNFWGNEIRIGKIDTFDKNGCYTLTKAEVKRGGRVSSIEYNPKYSIYKDGNIYWTCKKGRSPNRVDKRVSISTQKVYKFIDNRDVLLLSTYYANSYFCKGTIFRVVYDKGNATILNPNIIKFSNVERFDRKVNLLPFNTVQEKRG